MQLPSLRLAEEPQKCPEQHILPSTPSLGIEFHGAQVGVGVELHYVAKGDPEFLIILPVPPKCWDDRRAPLYPTIYCFFFFSLLPSFTGSSSTGFQMKPMPDLLSSDTPQSIALLNSFNLLSCSSSD